uniref:Thioredoxin domain-containing protein n=1 Tax=Hemiselmis tepida TaxID=464990 RepID=A0A7S0W2L5_9CRYP
MDEAKAHPVFVKFYAPWCGHCKKLAPTWDDLADKVEKAGQTGLVSIAKVDCTADGKQTCKDYSVRGFPTLKLLYPIATEDGKGTFGEVPYKGARSIDALYKFAIEAAQNPSAYLAKAKQEEEEAAARAKVEAEKAEKEAVQNNKNAVVKTVTASNFAEFVHKEAPVTFVKFYAPWCGHCKKLAPTWEQLGEQFKDDASVTIAKSDCTVHKDLCSKHGVRGYPTLLVFVNGESSKYEGGRDLGALSDFVKGKKPAAAAA